MAWRVKTRQPRDRLYVEVEGSTVQPATGTRGMEDEPAAVGRTSGLRGCLAIQGSPGRAVSAVLDSRRNAAYEGEPGNPGYAGLVRAVPPENGQRIAPRGDFVKRQLEKRNCGRSGKGRKPFFVYLLILRRAWGDLQDGERTSRMGAGRGSGERFRAGGSGARARESGARWYAGGQDRGLMDPPAVSGCFSECWGCLSTVGMVWGWAPRQRRCLP